MVVDMGRPHRVAGADVHRMNIGARIAEIGAPAGLILADDDRCTHRRAGVDLPIGAAGLGVERIDLAALAAEKYPASHHCRLRVGARGAGNAERPFQLQAWNVGGRELRHVGALEAMLCEPGAPSIPMRRAQRIGKVWRGRGTGRGARRSGTAFLGRNPAQARRVKDRCQQENCANRSAGDRCHGGILARRRPRA